MPSEIITFYSYKGGTGRSMALANTAWILASNRKRVLVLDWDLEAPGLHRYFHPFLEDKELTSSEGIIDFVIAFAAEAVSPSGAQEKDWYVPFANILSYASSLKWDFASPGTLDFVPAGRQGPDYASRVNSFNWQKFYERLGGGVFLEAAKRSMSGYDYVLIDSRTGVSDTSGVCTIQMPDVLVVCFTYNIQSIEGAASVAESALQQRRNSSNEPTLRILPVPMRVEFAEKLKLDLAKDAARARFDPLLWHFSEAERAEYWERVQVSYQPFYAYEETLATFGDKPREADTLLSRIEVITEYLTRREVKRFPPLLSDPSASEEKRLEWLAKFTRQPLPVKRSAKTADNKYWFYCSYARGDANEYVKKFFADLVKEVSSYAGVEEESVGFFDFDSIETGDAWAPQLLAALQSSRTMVCLYSPRYFNSVFCGKEFQLFRARQELYQEASLGPNMPPTILPVILTPFGQVPNGVANIQYRDADFPRVYADEGLLYMLKLRNTRDDYEQFVSQFARKLVKVAREYQLPSLETVPVLTDVPNAFAETGATLKVAERAGPNIVEFVFIVATRSEMEAVQFRHHLDNYDDEGWGWQPFFDGDRLGILAQTITTREGLFYRASDPSSDLMERLREAEGLHRVVILVIDPWSLRIDAYRQILSQYDARVFLNCGVLILWDTKDSETVQHRAELEQIIRMTFPRQLRGSGPQFFRPNVQSAEEFHRELSQMLADLRFNLLESASLLRPIEGEQISTPMIVKPIIGPKSQV
jgi:FxsC-like protein